MLVYQTTKELKSTIETCRKQGKKINFVPTMGALHQGHVSLIETAKQEGCVVVCSIFVNPIQFNDKADLERYPRPLEKDKELLTRAGCDILFVPDESEIYPEGSTLRPSPNGERSVSSKFDFGLLDKVMEGKHRPGHFNGVAIVVSKLFGIVNPQNAYFGQKDFQQVAIIKRMVQILKLPVKIISCPTVREADGLAMSSRNIFLSAEERKNAVVISKTLFAIKAKSKEADVRQLTEWGKDQIKQNPLMQLEYLEIVDADIFESAQKNKNAVACIAVKIGKVRLIDNVTIDRE